MAKILLLGDTHWGVRNDSPFLLDHMRTSVNNFLLPFIEENNIRHVIHLGDLFDRRKYLNFKTAKRCREDFLEPVSSLVDEIHIVAGNHDEYYKNTHEVNCLQEIVDGKYGNIKTYDRPVLVEVAGLPIHLIPWITESNSKESFDAITNSSAEVLIGHLEINGFELIKGFVCDHGLERDVFARFDLVFSGHFHTRNHIGNIHYIGAFADYIWSDYGSDRGFCTLDTETREVEYYNNPNTIFHSILYDDKTNPNLYKEDLSVCADKYVKILIREKDPYLFDRFLDNLYKVTPIDISIIEDMAYYDEIDEDFELDQAEDTQTIISKYIDNLTLDVNPDKLKTVMRNIHTEAMSLESVE